MLCPRCKVSLAPSTDGAVELHRCPVCEGTLVSQRRLIPLVEQSAELLASQVDLAQPVPAVPDRAGTAACPKCGDPMVTFGYMGMASVMLDRCASDWLVWIDSDELITMAVLSARTTQRIEERQRFWDAEKAKWPAGTPRPG